MTVLKAQCPVPRRIQLKCNAGMSKDVSITLKWAQIRAAFLEKTAFELSHEDFEHMTLEEKTFNTEKIA